MARKFDTLNVSADRRDRYEFWKRRDGDTMIVPDAKARSYVISAFANWKRTRPGTLCISSRMFDGAYRIEFAGISPAEATRARMMETDERLSDLPMIEAKSETYRYSLKPAEDEI